MPSIQFNDLTGIQSNKDFRSLGQMIAKASSDDKTAILAAGEIHLLSLANTIPAVGDIPAKRFVGSDGKVAAANSTQVIGVAPFEIANETKGIIHHTGLHLVTADAALAVNDPVKVGSNGRAIKHVTTQATVIAEITGVATSFTQPETATLLEIVQAVDTEADLGREFWIIGKDAEGEIITELIALDAEATTTPSITTNEFATVFAFYAATTGSETQDVVLRISLEEDTGATVCTLAAEADSLGIVAVEEDNQDILANQIVVTGPNSDETFVTVIGEATSDEPGEITMERIQFDGESPAVATTTNTWRRIDSVCVGEFTNAATASVKTVADSAGMQCGIAIVAAEERGDDALVFIKPNLL